MPYASTFRLAMLSPASPSFVDDALEYQLLGPHACARGTIPRGEQLAKMAWGLIRAFEVWDEYEVFEDAGVDFDMSDSEDEDDDFEKGAYAEWTKTPPSTYTYDSASDGTTTPTPRASPAPCSDTTYTYELRLDEAEHEWPTIFGAGEPVRSRWLLSFDRTAALLQAKAFSLAYN